MEFAIGKPLLTKHMEILVLQRHNMSILLAQTFAVLIGVKGKEHGGFL